MKILIIRQDHLGDLVLTTPLFRALSLAGHQVTVVARRSSLPVLEGNPYLTALIAFEDVAIDFPNRIFALGRSIRKLAPDLVLIPHAKPASLLLGVRSGFYGRIIAMWGGVASRILLCESLRSRLLDCPRHFSEIMLDMARAIGVDPAGLQPEIFLSEEEKNNAKKRLADVFGRRKVVIVHPGCAGNTCNLPIGTYIDFVRKLLEFTEAGILLSGIEQEREKFHEYLSCFEGNSRVCNTMGRLSLRHYCGAISQSNVLVTPSTGPLHLASALEIPTITPFCHRIGLCSKIWKNLGGDGVVLEPSVDLCEANNDGSHCDFRSSISSAQLLQASLSFLR